MPGWIGKWGKSAKSATTQLGEIFSGFGIYRVNRLYFSQLLQKKNSDGSHREIEAFQLHKFIDFFSTTKILVEDIRLASLEAFREYRFEKLIIQGNIKYMSKEFSPNNEEWDLVIVFQKAYMEKFNKYITYTTLGKWFFKDPYYFRRCLHNNDEYHFLDDHLGMMEDIIKGRMEPKGTNLDLTLEGSYLELVIDRLHRCRGAAGGAFNYYISKDSSTEEIILNLVRLGISRLKGGDFISFTSVLNEIGRSRNYLSHWKAFGFSGKDLELTIKYLEDRGLRILDSRLFNRIEVAINKYNNMFKEYFIKYEKSLVNHYLREKTRPYKHNSYPSTFLIPEVVKLQRKIIFEFQGGRDMETGEKFIDIYRRVNPDRLAISVLNSMSDKEVEEKCLIYIHRHHFKTWSQPFNKIDCRISVLVGLFREIHLDITHKIRLGSNYLNRQYEEKFREAINAILQRNAPVHWDQRYRSDFESDIAHGLIDPSVVFYLYRTSTQSYL